MMKSYSRMEMPANDLIKVIKRYQQCIQQINPVESDPQRVSHYIRKLSKLPIRLEELEKTGIGKTMNALRKADGDIAEEATSLVAKWKSNVMKQMKEEEPPEAKSDSENDDRSGGNSCISPLPMDNDITPEPVKSEYDPSFSKISIDDDKKSKYESTSKNKVRMITIKREGSHDRKRKHSEEGRDKNSKKEKLKKVEEHPEMIFDRLEKTIKEEPLDSFGIDADFVERRESVGDIKRKDGESEKKLLKKDHEKRHHKSSKHREEKSHRDSKHNREEKLRSHHEKKHESDDRYDSHKHRRDKRSKIRDKEVNHSKRDEKDRKSSKEFSETEGNSKKSVSRDVDNYKSDEASGDFFGAALLGIPVSASPKKKSTSSKSSNYQDSPPTFSSPKSNQSLDFLSNNIKLEPLSKDLDISDIQDYAGETYKAQAPSKYSNSNSKHDEHVSPSYSQPQKPSKPKGLSEEDMFSSMTSMKNRRTKVYHGFKVNSKFPTLFELCVRILQDNFDALEYTGGVPYEVLKPILEKVSVEQLFTFENFNPYLIGETDELWEHHAKKDFRKAERQEYETWRDLYLRCVEEREEKLQSLTENISQSMAKSTPVRKTKLAYVDAIVKPPRNVARQQAKHGTGITNNVARRSPKEPQPSPSAVQSVKERLAKEASSPNAIQIPTKAFKKKAAPLMQKTLQLFKGLKR